MKIPTDAATQAQAITVILRDVLQRLERGEIDEATAKRELADRCGKAPTFAQRYGQEGKLGDAVEPVTPLLRAANGVDAVVYSVSEPLTVEAVWARALSLRSAREESPPNVDDARRARLYHDVLHTIAADRGPLGDLARAALEAEE